MSLGETHGIVPAVQNSDLCFAGVPPPDHTPKSAKATVVHPGGRRSSLLGGIRFSASMLPPELRWRHDCRIPLGQDQKIVIAGNQVIRLRREQRAQYRHVFRVARSVTIETLG